MMNKLTAYECQIMVGGRVKNAIVVGERGKVDQYLYSKFGFGCIISSKELDGDVLIDLNNPEVKTTTEFDMINKLLSY